MTWESALNVAERVRTGQVTAEAVIEETLHGIARADSALNSFTTVLGQRALDDARRLDADIAAGRPVGRLAGAPFAVKNLFDVEGLTTLAGSAIRRGAAPAERDASLVLRLKKAGAILVGALNMDEFAYGFVTENYHYGATRNPHDRRRVAGGSSGGSAAAVAGGLVPLALGTDTNGSIRVPAALCGVYGLKPTLGRLPCDGVFPFVESLDHAGLFARTAEDVAAVYRILIGEPVSTVTGDLDPGAQGDFRVGALGGWFVKGAFPEVLDGLAAVGKAVGADTGVEVEGAEAARSAAFCLTAYEGAKLHARDLTHRPHEFDPAVRDRLLAGALLTDDVAALARRCRVRFRDEMRRLFERYDVLLAPTAPCPAPFIGEATMDLDGEPVSVRQNLGAYTQPLSFIGLPVLAAPVNRPGPLPVGVQIIAPPWREEIAIALALRLQCEGVLAASQPKEVP